MSRNNNVRRPRVLWSEVDHEAAALTTIRVFFYRRETSCRETSFYSPLLDQSLRNEFFSTVAERVAAKRVFSSASKRVATKQFETRGHIANFQLIIKSGLLGRGSE